MLYKFLQVQLLQNFQSMYKDARSSIMRGDQDELATFLQKLFLDQSPDGSAYMSFMTMFTDESLSDE